VTSAMSDSFQRVCAVADVAPESAISVEVGIDDIAIVNSGGQFYAVIDECSHASVPLSEGDVGDGEIECYMHGSRFDLTTGKPLQLPATEPVETYPVRIEDDQVYVDVDHPLPEPT
jgi:3-phenylpropionate/trans-cinnamate dioxygenase ferredoxin subunit